jgi:hypothetical protein
LDRIIGRPGDNASRSQVAARMFKRPAGQIVWRGSGVERD